MKNETIYNKLVRDRIPEIIHASGMNYEIDTLTDHAYKQALRDKLIEEATEAAQAKGDDLIKELADLYEVIDALVLAMNIDPITVKER